jgi:hypothetical protein
MQTQRMKLKDVPTRTVEVDDQYHQDFVREVVEFLED